jgi:hypothetical protein
MRLHWFESTMDAANKLLHVFMSAQSYAPLSASN